MEADLCRQRARCDVVRSAEGGEEVVERVLVGQVHAAETKTPAVLLGVEEVVFADGGIEEISLGDPGWIFVVVLCVGCRNADESRGKSCSVTHSRQRLRWRRFDTIAGEPGLELLVGGQAGCSQVDAGLLRREV